MRKTHVVFAVLFVVVALIGIGCGSDNPFDPQETIVFSNRSGINGVACYIDNELRGTVNSGQDLQFEGDYEGDRVVYARGGGFVWPARTIYIGNGVTYIYTLTR